MGSKAFKSLDELKVLKGIITAIEEKNENEMDSEYLMRNIQLVDKIISIFQGFKNELMENLTKN